MSGFVTRVAGDVRIVRSANVFERQSITGAPKGYVSGAYLAVGQVVLLGFPDAKKMAEHDPLANVQARDDEPYEVADEQGG